MTTILEPLGEWLACNGEGAVQKSVTRNWRSGWVESLAFLYLPFSFAVLLTFARSPDDAFITLRYAWNLLHGHGAVFNPGEFVQGFSSPLHLFVSTLVVGAPGGAVLLKAKLLSIGFGFLAVREGSKLLGDCHLPTWAKRTGFLLIGTSFILATSSVNGLETSLYVWLTVVLIRRLVAGKGVTAPLATAAIAFLVAGTRPESLLLLVAMGVVALIVERPQPLVRRALWLAGGIIAVLIVASASLLYYGDPLPNTFYAKSTSLGSSLDGGLKYLATSLQPVARTDFFHPGLVEFLLIAQVAFFAAGVGIVFQRARRFSYAVVAVLVQVLFVLKSGGDWMYGGRFLAPVVIPFIVVQVVGIAAIGQRLRDVAGPLCLASFASVAALVVVAVSAPFAADATPIWQVRGGFDDQSLIASAHYLPYSDYWAHLPLLASCIPPGGSIATSEVGYLGFARHDLRILDLRGLTDRAIAKSSPTTAKRTWGVLVPSWSDPRSPAGRRLTTVKPDLIVVLADEGRAPPMALAGTYHKERLVEIGPDAAVEVYVPLDRPSTCSGSATD